MQGFHTLRMRDGKVQNLQDFELMTMILSALSWRNIMEKLIWSLMLPVKSTLRSWG